MCKSRDVLFTTCCLPCSLSSLPTSSSQLPMGPSPTAAPSFSVSPSYARSPSRDDRHWQRSGGGPPAQGSQFAVFILDASDGVDPHNQYLAM